MYNCFNKFKNECHGKEEENKQTGRSRTAKTSTTAATTTRRRVMRQRVEIIDALIAGIGLFFLIILTLYHLSHDGYLGLSEKTWGAIWGISENGLSLFAFFLLSLYTVPPLSLLFRYVFIPYFALKLIYYFSCYSGVYLLSAKAWSNVWSILLVVLIIVGLGYLFYNLKRHA